MTDKERLEANYRFSGYELIKIQLDETGPTYVVLDRIHPYYINQPLYWQKSPGNAARMGPLVASNLYVMNG